MLSLRYVASRYVMLIHDMLCCLCVMLPFETGCSHKTCNVIFTLCCQTIHDVDTRHTMLSLRYVASWYMMLIHDTQCCLYVMLIVDTWCWHKTCNVVLMLCCKSIRDFDTRHKKCCLYFQLLVVTLCRHKTCSVVFLLCWESIHDVNTRYVILSERYVDSRYMMSTLDMQCCLYSVLPVVTWCWHKTCYFVYTWTC